MFVSNQVRRLRTRRTRLLEGGCLDRRQVLKREGPRCTKREQADLYDLAHFYRSIWGQYLSLSLAPPAAHLPSSGIPSPGTMLPRAYTDAHPPPARTHTTHTRMHACTHARMHARTRLACARARTHAHTHTRTHAHTHARTRIMDARTLTRCTHTVHTYPATTSMQTIQRQSRDRCCWRCKRTTGLLSTMHPCHGNVQKVPVYLIPSPCLSNTELLSI